MYYEEKEIDGIWYYKNSPDGFWIMFGIPQYKDLVKRLQQQVNYVDLDDVGNRYFRVGYYRRGDAQRELKNTFKGKDFLEVKCMLMTKGYYQIRLIQEITE